MIQNSISITIIGAGNVGSHLASALYERGFTISQVFSRSIEKARAAAAISGADAVDTISRIKNNADLYILAVKDAAIRDIACVLRVNGLVVHTSGTSAMDELSAISNRTGVFYPLQTFTKGRTLHWKEIPICIEAGNPEDLSLLHSVASALSGRVIELDSAKRRQLHLAAVFVNNFVNELLNIAGNIVEKNQLDISLVHALALETVEKAFALSPQKAQTGPALRHDEVTMQEHLNMLDNPLQKEIYRLLSLAIRQDQRE